MFFSILLVYAVIITIDMGTYRNPAMASVERVIIVLEHFCFSVLTLMPITFLLHRCGENIKNSIRLRAAVMLWFLFCILLFVTQFMDMFYYVTPDNQYNRGPLFPLMIAPLAAVMIINTAALIRKRKKISKKIFGALLVNMLPTAILVIMYMFASVDILVSFWLILRNC